MSDRARQLAVAAARSAADDRCEDVVVLDLRGTSPVCDYFVIATGTSDRQLRAAADHIEEQARQRHERPIGQLGRDSAHWILLDFFDVVVHLFDAEARGYYDLELLWGDAPRVDWQVAPA